VAAALIASGASAAQSSQASVTLGSDLATEPDLGGACLAFGSDRGCLYVNDVLPGRELISPIDGVIVRWRARLGDAGAQTIRIRVLRPFDPDQFTVISSGQLEPIPAGAGTYAFPAQLPIHSGDQVGGEAGSGALIAWEVSQSDAHFFAYNPSPPDGETTLDPFFDGARQVALNVDVEPDCDKDGLGDETQDADVSSCHPAAAPVTPVTTVKKKKCKKKKHRSAESAKKKKCKKKKHG
jgi:hypothetical protein